MPAILTPSRFASTVAAALLLATGTAQANSTLQLMWSDLKVGYPTWRSQHIQTADQQRTVPFDGEAITEFGILDYPAGRVEWSMKPGPSGLGWYEFYFEGKAIQYVLDFEITNVQLRLNEDARVRFFWYGRTHIHTGYDGGVYYGVNGARWSGTGLPDSGFTIYALPGEKTLDLKAGDYALSTVTALDTYCVSCDMQYLVGLEVLEVISTPVPEPSTVALGLLGLGVVAVRARRRNTTP
jgi:PEP-CTERM motif